MQLQRVAVLGGGPGGLYAARLLKLAYPSCEVVVHEQGEPDITFGFGVGLAAGTQRNLELADPETLRDILAAGCRHDMTMQVGDRIVRVHNDRLIGIARTELLAVLQRHAEKAGVRLEYGTRRRAGDLDADVVIAADGIGSVTREAGDFGGNAEVGRGLYLWCGADFALTDAVFAPVETEHGTFDTHAYPYSGGRSTFLIETDEQTWRRAGFEASTGQTPPDASDLTSLHYLQEAFAGQLQGHSLIGNRTRWLRFRTVRCERWSRGRTVLLGDAAHTAHFSIGSGTKLAMEDAIGLAQALGQHRAVPDALAAYEAERRPQVESTQRAAQTSLQWFEETERYAGTLEPIQFAMSLLTRSLRITHENLKRRDPAFVARVDRWFAAQAANQSGINVAAEPPPPPMFTPFRLRDLVVPNRVVVSPMCQYSAEDGMPSDWHLVHLGSRAIGGAGLIMTEM